MEIKIEQQDDGKKGVFTAVSEGNQVGLMTYTWAGESKFIIDHTEASPDFPGKGVGRQLVTAGVDFARSKGLKIVPLCPFAKRLFERNAADWSDVLF